MKKDAFSCSEVPVPEREDEVSLENCSERWSAKDEVQNWKCKSWEFSQCRNHIKEQVMEAAPELPIIQVKRFSKVENSVEEIYEPVNFPWNKAVIRGRNYDYELKGLTYHLGSQMLCHYITAVKFKHRNNGSSKKIAVMQS